MVWKVLTIMSERLAFVPRATAEGAIMRKLRRCYGISAPTGHKLLRRFQEGRPAALETNHADRRIVRSGRAPRASD
jgi:hypothetical protein